MIIRNFPIQFLVAILLITSRVVGENVSDSLEKALAATNDDELKIELLIDLTDRLSKTDHSKALTYGLEAYGLAENSSNTKGQQKVSLIIASIYYYLSDLNNAMHYASISKDLAEDLNLDQELAQSLDAIGVIYYDIGYQAKSSENFFQSLRIYEKLKDKNGIGANYCRIGTLYLDQKDWDKAADYYTKSIELAKEINSSEGIASNLNNLAKVYFEKKEYEQALKFFNEALQMNLEADETYLAASNYLNIADVYLELKQYKTAISNLNHAKELFDKLGNKLRLAKSQILLSEIYLETGQKTECELLAKNALHIGKGNGYKEIIVSAAGTLSKLYLAGIDSASAFRFYILEKQYRDSLFLEEKQKTLTRLELQYQFEKNEKNLELTRQRKNVVISVISGCLFFSLIIIILILKQLKLKAKKLALEKENHQKELTFKNKEMVLNVMSLMKKNEMLAGLSEKLITFEKDTSSSESKEIIKKVAVEIQKSQGDEIWKEFSHRFKEVHGDFYDKLLQNYPTLTPNELKLCAFLRLNMSSKDIAELTGQRVSSLETARYRLRQKLGIANSDVNLITFLASL